ncbi:DUF4158 domain-containing protein, partial [Klebsiella pneumoniae]
MPRRLILSATERDTLLALPESQDDLIRYYTFNDSDLSLIRQRRGDANRLGFAVQLCLLRYPGYALGTDSELPEPVILWVAKQVQAEPASWAKGTVAKLAMRQPFVLFKGLTFQKLCLPGAFRPGDHHNK